MPKNNGVGSPHGYLGVARDLSGTSRSASGDPTIQVERCVCGGDIEALVAWPGAIADAVDLHNHSTVHQQWRAWRDLLR